MRENLIVSKEPREISHKRMEIFYFPKWGRKVSVEKIPDSEVRAKVEKFIGRIVTHLRNGHGVFVWGAHGAGKSAIAYLIAKGAVQKTRGLSTCWVRCREISKLVIENPMFDEQSTWRYALYNSDLLVIDDLVVEETGSGNMLEDLIRYRYDEELPTIYTSNEAPGELSGAAIRDLLADSVYTLRVPEYKWRRDVQKLGEV